MLVLKLWYLFYFASASCLQPFLPLIFRRAGLSEQHVGTIAALRPWVGLPCGALLSGIADKWRIHRIILTTCFTLSVCVRLSVSMATSFSAILTVILIADAINSSTNTIVDAAAVAACASSEEKEAYGRQRLYGAVGWGAFSYVSGSAQSLFHGSSTSAFILYGVLALATLIPTLQIPYGPLHAKLEEKNHTLSSGGQNIEEGDEEEDEEGENGKFAVGSGSGFNNNLINRSRETSPLRHAFDGSSTPTMNRTPSPHKKKRLPSHHHQKTKSAPETRNLKNKNFCQKLGLLLSSPEALLFFATVTVMGYAVGTIESFLFLFLEDLGGSESLMGLTLTVTCVAETIIFYYAGRIMQYLGLDRCFHVCFLAFLIRLGSYATLAHWKTPWAVLPVELLHGITFGLNWSAGTAKSAAIAPPGLEATTQSAFQGFIFGLGYGLGGFIAGRKYHLNGPEAVFRFAFWVVAVGWLVTSAVGWILRKWEWIDTETRMGALSDDEVVYSEVENNEGVGINGSRRRDDQEEI